MYRDKHGDTISTNYVNKQHSRVRTVLHKAVREGIISANPYGKFKLKNEPTTRERLTEEELEQVATHSFAGNSSLIKVRDFFLFCCYTGLRYGDAYDLKMKDIKEESDGSQAIDILMGKADGKVYVPLLEPAKEIIVKYVNDNARKVHGYVLPRYSNQKVNLYLKTIAELAGIEKELTHHVARHTCATYLLNNGVPIEVVQNILGHTDVKTTKIYAKMLHSTVRKEMNRINERFK